MRPRCECFKCRSVFTAGSGPELTDKDIENSIVYICPGCRHGTTIQQWIMLDTMEEERRWAEALDTICNELTGGN
jgi:hypothetical protein